MSPGAKTTPYFRKPKNIYARDSIQHNENWSSKKNNNILPEGLGFFWAFSDTECHKTCKNMISINLK